MARPRVIDQNAILDAAEDVVVREGATNLTLEAVACQAGISKASVLYDYKNKQALISAIVERSIETETAKYEQLVQRFGADPDAAIRGRIAAAAEPVSDHSLYVGVNLCSALSERADLQELFQKMTAEDIDRVLTTSSRPRSALLALLAVFGFRSMEYLGMHRWSKEDRSRILEEIAALIEIDLPPASKPVMPPL